MKATLHGRVDRPAVAVVGIWDPFAASHRELMQALQGHARACGCTALVILIDPPPGTISPVRFRYRVAGWPVYDGVPARIRLIRECGVEAVLRVTFTARDYAGTAAQFLDQVRAHVPLAELWLGALQHLGPGEPGSEAAVARYATVHGIKLTVLPLPPVGGYDVRALLAAGRLKDAAAIVGHPPIWARPASGALRLAWSPGVYRAASCWTGASNASALHTLELIAQPDGPARLQWPSSRVPFLAFVAGPADTAEPPAAVSFVTSSPVARKEHCPP